MGAAMTFVHFELGGDRLALPLSDVREVARVLRHTPVPRAPAHIRGVANIRGRVVTLLDADVLYSAPGGAAAGREDPGQAVVFASPRDHLALFVRSRVQIGRGQEAEVEGGARGPAPGDGSAPPAGRVVRFEDGIVQMISAADLAAHCEAKVLERYRRRA